MPKRILLADDSITIQKVVELTFSDGDFEVVAVPNGAKALAKLGEWRPDIVLADVIMPEKNGYEVCEAIKTNPAFVGIPVILLTGTFEPFDPDRAERVRADAVVTKPFESQNLIAKVEQLLAQAAAPAAAPVASAFPAPPPPRPAADVSTGVFPQAPPPMAPPPTPAVSPWADVPPPRAAMAPPPAPPEDIFASRDIEADIAAFENVVPPASGTSPIAPVSVSPPPPPPPPPPPAADPFAAFDAPASDSVFDAPSAPPPAADTFGTMFIPSSSLTDGFDEPEPPPPPRYSPPPPPLPEPEPPAADPFAAFAPAPIDVGGTMAIPREIMAQANELAAPPTSTLAISVPPPAVSEPAEFEDAFGGAESIPSQPEPGAATMFISSPARLAAPPPEPFGDAFSVPSEPEEPAPPAEVSVGTVFVTPVAAEPPAPLAPPEPPVIEAAPVPVFVPPPVALVEEAAPVTPPPAEAPVVVASVVAPPPMAISAGGLSDEDIEKIARRVVEKLSEGILRDIAWEVVPDLAEIIVKKRIAELEGPKK